MLSGERAPVEGNDLGKDLVDNGGEFGEGRDVLEDVEAGAAEVAFSVDGLYEEEEGSEAFTDVELDVRTVSSFVDGACAFFFITTM